MSGATNSAMSPPVSPLRRSIRGQGGLSQDPGGTTGWTFQGSLLRGLDDSAENCSSATSISTQLRLAQIVMALPGVDVTRVGAMGGSQGGALTLPALRSSRVYDWRRRPTRFSSDFKRVWATQPRHRCLCRITRLFPPFDPLHESKPFREIGLHRCPQSRHVGAMSSSH